VPGYALSIEKLNKTEEKKYFKQSKNIFRKAVFEQAETGGK